MNISEIEFSENYLQRASFGKRLANYLIDLVFFYICFYSVFILLLIINPTLLASVENIDGTVDRIITTGSFGILIGIVEGLLKGRTPGKYLTGTITVNDDGSRIDFATGFKRGLIKCIPFVVLSALSSIPKPWQDKWTSTYVIDIKQTIYYTENEGIDEIGNRSNFENELANS